MSVLVFVLDKQGRPLMPCTGKRARLLLTRRKAFVRRMQPFTIQLKERMLEDSKLQPVELKIDPGSKHTGMALVRDSAGVKYCLNLYQLDHRGHLIHRKLLRRALFRARRRQRKTRHRPTRFLNRSKSKGWIPPSIMHRVHSTLTWVLKFQRRVPLTKLVVERNCFDTQKLRNPEIDGVVYQRGTLFGFEVWGYLLAKWGYQCAYCLNTDRPLEKDHVIPKSQGGTDAVTNLVPSCRHCNQAKGTMPVEQFLKRHPDRLARILKGLKTPLKDAAMMNATRNKLMESLESSRLPIEASTGGRTKWNRCQFGISKSHALDALCTGEVEGVKDWKGKPTQVITCMGRGRYSRTRADRFGFPRAFFPRTKRHFGFATGDLVTVNLRRRAHPSFQSVRKLLRIVVMSSGQFHSPYKGRILTFVKTDCQLVQRNYGYSIDVVSRL